MKKTLGLLACVLALATFVPLQAQTPAPNLTGTWQGTLQAGQEPHVAHFRVVLHLSPDPKSGWKGEMLSIDQSPTPSPLTSVTLNGTDFAFALDAFHVKYHGTVSEDGNSIKGTFTQGGDLPLTFERATATTEWKIDSSPHKVQFVNVEKDVKLEVLDWGGQGRPLVLLAGLGGTAHVFDQIAPKLATKFHVIGITRRGFGASSVPEPTVANYSAQRLGDDVLAAIHELKLEKPIVGGHSIAGEELSYIGTAHPDQVAGLIYLDAGYPYAYYDASRGDLSIDTAELQHDLKQLTLFSPASEQKKIIDQLQNVDLPALQKDLEVTKKRLAVTPEQPALPDSPEMRVAAAVIQGETKFSTVHCPALAIFASPHDLGPMAASLKPEQRAAMEAMDADTTGPQVKAFQLGNPNAKVVVLAHASHAVFASNEADVLREIDSFAATLKQ